MPPDTQKPEAVKPFTEQSILWPLTTGYTILYLGIMIADFALRSRFTMPAGFMYVYTALLAAYAGDKEIRRWMGKYMPARWGSVFVYAWFVFFAAAYTVSAIWPSFELPADLTKVCLQVLGVFFGTKASSKLYSLQQEKKEAGIDISSHGEKVMQALEQHGRITNEDVQKIASVSRATALRVLNQLEESGQIKQEGTGRGIYYVKAE